MTVPSARRGFILITVLIVTAVGLLFGAGALLLFRYQCQQRIDRQHELEKLCAVRSALNYIQTTSTEIEEGGKSFRYHTASERDLGVHVHPVAPIFPSDVEKHLFMESNGQFQVSATESGGYNGLRDYEYGSIGATNLPMNSYDPAPDLMSRIPPYGLAVTNLTVTNVKWWVNIGMRNTGSWHQDDYGRRYYFYLKNCVGGSSNPENAKTSSKRDLMRLCIIRDVINTLDAAGNPLGVGRQRGWPLSQEGERALVFQSPESDVNAMMTLWEYWYEGGVLRRREVSAPFHCKQSFYNMGLQIAGDKISMFYIEKAVAVNSPVGCTFSDVMTMPKDLYEYFSQERTIGGRLYDGVVKNAYGRVVRSPELRAVIEIEACSSVRPVNNNYTYDFLTNFRVTPAYQYDVFLEHPVSAVNLATVAQRIGTYDRYNPNYTVLTYDTHGTENKGFRKDEREAERKRNRR